MVDIGLNDWGRCDECDTRSLLAEFPEASDWDVYDPRTGKRVR